MYLFLLFANNEKRMMNGLFIYCIYVFIYLFLYNANTIKKNCLKQMPI